MKILPIFFLILTSIINIYGQNLTLDLSGEINLQNVILEKLVHADKDGTYLSLRENRASFSKIDKYIAKYDQDFNEVYFKTFSIENRLTQFIGFYHVEDHIIYLQAEDDRGQDVIILTATSINNEGVLSRPKTIGTISYKSDFRPPNIEAIYNQDSTKLLVTAVSNDRSLVNKNDLNYKVATVLINNKLDVISKNKLIFPHPQVRTEGLKWLVSEDNSIFHIAKIYDESKNQILGDLLGPTEHIIKLYKILPDGEFDDIAIQLGEYYSNNTFIKEHPYKDEIYMVNLIRERGNSQSVGLFTVAVNSQSNDIIFSEKYILNEKDLEYFGRTISGGIFTNNIGFKKNFEVADIIFYKNGQATITMESIIIDADESVGTGATGVSGSVANTTFTNEHIITVGISENGKVKKLGIIPHVVRSSLSGDYSGVNARKLEATNHMFFTTMSIADTPYFLYNDNELNVRRNNIDASKYKSVNRLKDATPVIAFFDSKNNLKRKIITDLPKNSVYMPKFTRNISENSAITILDVSEYKLFFKRPKIRILKFDLIDE